MVTEPGRAHDSSRPDRNGSRSARGLLFTVLGEFVLSGGGMAWTATLIDALGALGVEEKASRQALARSASRGWLKGERVGRRTRWHLTDSAARLLIDGTERIYSFNQEIHPWDGRWLVLLISVPEARRQLRYQLRVRLGWAGFAPLGSGLWISPRVEHESEAEGVVAELGLAAAARSFIGDVGSIGDVRQLVREAWDLDAIEAEYEEFVERSRRIRPASTQAAFAALATLVHEWRRFPFLDPELPPDLLPVNWSGERAAKVFHQLHDRWQPAAWEWWNARVAAAS
ncbi:MAG: PaaX family transcriptional regulator [Acidimicrobiales bacterium]